MIEASADAALSEAERLLAERRLDLALAALDRAEARGADADRCSGCRWIAAMLLGDFESAWLESDALRRREAPDPHRFWQGEPIAGRRVMLRCLHGFGDAVQFLRYAPLLRALASHVTVEVPPRFIDISVCFDGVDEVITWGEETQPDPPAWDVQVEIMELPYLFRTRLCDLPITTDYLHLPESNPLPAEVPAHLQVGIASSAGSWNPARELPPALWQPLLSTPGCEFWNLQGQPDLMNIATGTRTLREHPDCRASILGLAGLIAQLDLVITVDTLSAHLAGALGIPTWVLLQYEADWRWLHHRTDSPWYPSLRLFRQPAPVHWTSVITDVGVALTATANTAKRVHA